MGSYFHEWCYLKCDDNYDDADDVDDDDDDDNYDDDDDDSDDDDDYDNNTMKATLNVHIMLEL